MSVLPLLQILFFIAAYFAPQDATQIEVTGPDLSARWTLNGNEWAEGGGLWSVKGTSILRRESGKPDESVDVLPFVKQALTNDWKRDYLAQLSSHRSLEKVERGWVLRLNTGDASEKVYRITYH
jgi:hypothetical protein